MTNADVIADEIPAPRAYASFTARLRAVVTDMIVIAVGLVLIMLIPDIPGSGRLMLAAMISLLLLYEPILVWRYGATIGHRWNHLRIVADDTGGNPTFPQALLRFLIKSVLGLFSFITMALTRRHQAVHDRLTRTTVRIQDLARVATYDIAWERVDEPAGGLPSRVRRVAVILVYELTLYMLVGAVSNVTMSEACAARNACSTGDRIALTVLSIGWLATVAWTVIYGWKGKLIGARRLNTELQ